MKKILANDGIDDAGKTLLESAGFSVNSSKAEQDKLAETINQNNYEVLTVRSATKVRKDIIDACPNLKVIARGGVGMDNIDVEYAKQKGIEVINTPAASSLSVAELVFAHLFGLVRFLPDSNRNMPTKGNTDFDALKKKYSKGSELRGKTLGIIGFGRIGQAVAQIALGVGMKVIAHDPFLKEATIHIDIEGAGKIPVKISTSSFDEAISKSDFITLHVPGGNIINEEHFKKMKDGVGLVNASRGGVINEKALLNAINSGKIAFAALDVFDNEPKPDQEILSNPKISLTPHIGAATAEAQERIGIELAEKIINHFKK